MLEVRLLGAFELRHAGRLLDLPSRPAQSLLAFLILNPGSLHRRERLAGLLWPASTEESARNNLRQALWRIRGALPAPERKGQPYIVADNFTIGFNRDAPYHLDVAELDLEPSEDWPADRLIPLAAAYAGELLPGFYEDWVVLERERLKAAFDRKIQMLLGRLLQEARWPEAADWAERWIAAGAVPEPAYRALMTAAYGLGDASAAAAAFHRCADALERELGVRPSRETEELLSQITYGTLLLPGKESGPSHPTPEIAKPVPPPAFLGLEGLEGDRPEPIFVGRERELRELMGFLRRALAGEGLSVVVTGEPGIGKTALLRRFALQAQGLQPDLVVAAGSGNALTGSGDPYLPFRDILGTLTGDVEAKWAGGVISGAEARKLWALLPHTVQAILTQGPDLVGSFLAGPSLLARVRAHTEASHTWLGPLQRLVERSALRPTDAAFRQKDLFEQFTRVLQALAKESPVVLILDDLQWADEESLGLLFHLSRRTRDHRILLVGATRPLGDHAEGRPGQRLLSEILTELRRVHGDVQVHLEIDGEGQTFVEAYLDTEPNLLDKTFRIELLRHTGGHPLFTVELLRAMEARGDLVMDERGRWVRGESLSWEDLPARVEGVIEERLKGLDEPLMHILHLACVEGEEFTAEVISRVWGSDARVVVGHLSESLDRHHRLVSALGSRRLADTRLSIYRFRHILFQRHLYARLDTVQRAYMHEDVGNALEAIYGEHTGEIAIQLAHQFSHAGMASKAVAYLQEAAERAKRISAHREAVAHLKEALQLLDNLPEGPDRKTIELAVQTSLGVSLSATLGYAAPEVEQAFRRGRELCQELGASPPLFPVLYGLRAFYLARAEYATAHDLGGQLLKIAQAAQDRELLVEAHQASGTTLFYMGELEKARQHLERCLSLYDLPLDYGHAVRYGQDPAVACHSYLSLICWLMGQGASAAEESALAMEHAEKIAHPLSMVLALVFAALLARERGQNEIAHEHAQAAEGLSAGNGFPFWQSTARILVGILRAQGGERDGVALIHEGLDGWQGTGSQLGRSYYTGLLAAALLQWGEHDQGLQIVDEALGTAEANGERLNLAELHRLRAIALERLGRRGEADQSIHRAIEIAHTQGAASYELRGALTFLGMRPGEPHAERALREAYALLPDPAEGPEAEQARGALGLAG